MSRFLWVCLAGAAGAGARYWLSSLVTRAFGPGFPYGTLAVNLVGSFLLALVMQIGARTELLSPATHLAVTVGLLGSFTTYSTFSYETMHLLQQEAFALAGLNVALTLAACLAASFLGFYAGKVLGVG